MSEKRDHLSNEVSVFGEITETGLKAGAKSRALSAFDRLLGSVVDIPSAYFESIATKVRATTSVEKDIIHAEGSMAKKKLFENKDFGDRVVQGFLNDQARKQLNKDAVVHEAIEELKIKKHEDEIDSSEYIDEDWLNVFERYAQDASSEKLRKLWGQVLAGQIRNPRSFSLSTLRFMSELDKETAELFERIVEIRSSEGFILKPKNLSGNIFLDYTFLEEVGLLTGVLGFSRIEFKNDGKPTHWILGDYCLKFTSNQNINIPVIKITRVGKEILKILPVVKDQNFLENAALEIKDQCELIELNKISKRLGPDKILMNLIKKIK